MTETREYPVPLTREELLTAAEIAAMLSREIEDKKAVFMAQRSEFRDCIKNLTDELKFQLNKLNLKREVREVTLEIEFNTPEEGKKTIREAETYRLLDVVDMTDDDRENLFAQPAVVLPVADADLLRRRAGTPLWQGNTLNAAIEDGESSAEVCSICNECHSVLHINNDKPVCGICRDKKNKKNFDAIMRLKNYWSSRGSNSPKFRPGFGHGCTPKNRDTTCFRFMLPSGSWGNPVYLAGDYEYKGSQAHAYYQALIEEGWAEG